MFDLPTNEEDYWDFVNERFQPRNPYAELTSRELARITGADYDDHEWRSARIEIARGDRRARDRSRRRHLRPHAEREPHTSRATRRHIRRQLGVFGANTDADLPDLIDLPF